MIGVYIGGYIIIVGMRAEARGRFSRLNIERFDCERASERDLTSPGMEDDVKICSCGAELQ